MSDWSFSPVSRRTVLTTSAVSVASLAGCSASDSRGDVPLNRIVAQSNTEQMERVELTLSYAPQDSAAERPVRGVYEVPTSDELLVVDDFEGAPGFYCLTAFSERHGTHGMYTVNSCGPAVKSDPVQFEVSIRKDGNIQLNLGEAGSKISLPG